MTLSEAVQKSFNTTLMVSIISAVGYEYINDSYNPKGRNKYMLMGSVIFLSNVMVFYLDN